MKLSMWMIAERLKEYMTFSSIASGKSTITGVRFILEDPAVMPSEYVYIVRSSDAFLFDDNPDTFLLTHHKDLIMVDGLNIQFLINEVLAAFDYYNNWESNLLQVSSSDNPFQQIIDLSTEVFGGPINLGDMAGSSIAHSSIYGPGEIDYRWDSLLRTNMVGIPYTAPPIKTETGEIREDYTSEPALYTLDGNVRYISAMICVAGEQLAGLYIQEHAVKFTPCHIQLAATLCTAIVHAISQQSGTSPQVVSIVSLADSLLEGRPTAAEQLDRLRVWRGWQPPWILITVRIRPNNTSRFKVGGLLANVRKLSERILATDHRGDVVVLMEEAVLGDFLYRLEAGIDARHLRIGVSFPFHGWPGLKLRYRQAVFAMEQAGAGAGVYYCRDHAFRHMLASIGDQNRELELCHPALPVLLQYDRGHGTKLFETLYEYVRHERNLVMSAKALYIHRNTLVYRVRRICELLELDLDDADERAFLLLSYMLMQSGGASVYPQEK